LDAAAAAAIWRRHPKPIAERLPRAVLELGSASHREIIWVSIETLFVRREILLKRVQANPA
jgi:hypothetical protein